MTHDDIDAMNKAFFSTFYGKKETHMLYEVAVIAKKTEDAPEELIVAPVAIIATSAENAKMNAARSLDAEVDLNEVEILVRPFVR